MLTSLETHEWLKKKTSSRGLGQVFEQVLNLDRNLDKKASEKESDKEGSSLDKEEDVSPSSSMPLRPTKPKQRQPSQPILGIQTSLSRGSSSTSSSSRILSQSSSVAPLALDASTLSPSAYSSLPSAYPSSSIPSAIASGLSGSDMDGYGSTRYDFDSNSRPPSQLSMTSWGSHARSGSREGGAVHTWSGSREGNDLDWQDPKDTSAEGGTVEVIEEEDPYYQTLGRSTSNRSRDQASNRFVGSNTLDNTVSALDTSSSNTSSFQPPKTPTISLPPSLPSPPTNPIASTSSPLRTLGKRRKLLHDYASQISAEMLYSRLEADSSRNNSSSFPSAATGENIESTNQR